MPLIDRMTMRPGANPIPYAARHKGVARTRVRVKVYPRKRRSYRERGGQTEARRAAARKYGRGKGRLAKILRKRLWACINRLKLGRRAGSFIRDLGCTVPEFRAHIESQFWPGMTWDNHGPDGWHLDHVIPLAKFDLTDREQFLKAAHFTNYQPLWSEHNLAKNDRLNWTPPEPWDTVQPLHT